MKRGLDSMFFGASNEIHHRAKILRSRMTKSEQLLWEELQNKKLGYKFRRQHPIARFIVDFYCHQKRIAIEVDGGIHSCAKVKERDDNRSKELEKFGVSVLRFTNFQVENEISCVVKTISEKLS